MLDLNDVTVTVSSDELGERTLLDKVTCSIGPGDRIGLVGVNGAGKTTLLNLFDGSRKPDSAGSNRERPCDWPPASGS